MHSVLLRANGLLTFGITMLAALSVLASLTDVIHQTSPQAQVKVAGISRFGKWPEAPYRGDDQISLVLEFKADLTSLFSWNTKQVYVFICAEYATPRNSYNQVVLWDRIIEEKENAVINTSAMRTKYFFIDQGNHLRGRSINLTLYWNVMPIAGGLYTGKQVFSGIELPSEYGEVSRVPHSREHDSESWRSLHQRGGFKWED
eukprot:TRINITY_DN38568_c0_g1_i1.p1 TRINITY_DN38568_c0_g1~~TRINITY_DN38568_c0_g1_i1.p1  ORF type:complete len:202 (+),score=18.45 TRINITY_DN38568_c0_g1_i1:420-1025(+)